MFGISLIHLLVFAIVIAIWIIPLWRISARAGYPGALALLALFPPLAIILLWALAFAKWPALEGAEERSA